MRARGGEWSFTGIPTAMSTAAVFERLPATPRPPENPAPRLASRAATEVLVGVHAVAAALGEQPRGGQPFGEADEGDREPAEEDAGHEVDRDARKP